MKLGEDLFGAVMTSLGGWREGECDVAGGDTSTLDVDEGERFF